MSQNNVPKNILVIGGTGFVGSQVTVELLKSKSFVVKVLIRKESLEKRKELVESFQGLGGIIVEGDISDVESIVKALEGVDTVVSAIDLQSIPIQLNIVEAAKKVPSVKRIVPSEYGYDITSIPSDYIMEPNRLVQKAIKDAGLEYTWIFSGAFYEFITSTLYGFDQEKGEAHLPGTGDEVIFATLSSDVAKLLPEILLDPLSRNNGIFVSGERTTFRKIIKSFEKYSGKKYDVHYYSGEDLLKQEEAAEDIISKIYIHLKYLSLFDSNPKYDHTPRYSITPTTIEQYAQSLSSKKSE